MLSSHLWVQPRLGKNTKESAVQPLQKGRQVAPDAPGAGAAAARSVADNPMINFDAMTQSVLPAQVYYGYHGLKFAGQQSKLPFLSGLAQADFDPSALNVQELSFDKYIEAIVDNPLILRTSKQRAYDMIIEKEGWVDPNDPSKGFNEPEIISYYGKEMPRYKFFSEPELKQHALYGVDDAIQMFVKQLHAGALNEDFGKRMIVFIGGPGSAKSSMVSLLKKGLEDQSRTKQGAMYGVKWTNLPADIVEQLGLPKKATSFVDSVRTEPFYILPKSMRDQVIRNAGLNDKLHQEYGREYNLNINDDQTLPPASRLVLKLLLLHEAREQGLIEDDSAEEKVDAVLEDGGAEGGAEEAHDPSEVLAGLPADKVNHLYETVLSKYLKAFPVVINEKDKVGIGTYEPKDVKNMTMSQLVGEPDLLKSLKTSAQNPAAYNFGLGEMFAANRGMMEFVELLKMSREFLNPVLSLNEEQKVKPETLPYVYVDELVIGHSNLAEYRDLLEDDVYAPHRARMAFIHVPYNFNIEDEVRVYKKFLKETVDLTGIHMAPHTLETLAVFAIMSRLIQPENAGINTYEKMNRYNNRSTANITDESVARLYDEGQTKEEGIDGVSPRDMRQVLASFLTDEMIRRDRSVDGVVALAVLENLSKSPIMQMSKESRAHAQDYINAASKYLLEQITRDIQSAVSGGDKVIRNFFDSYIVQVNQLLMSQHAGRHSAWNTTSNVNTRFLQDMESLMGIRGGERDNFREMIRNRIRSLLVAGGGKWDAADLPLEDYISMDDFPKLKKAAEKYAWQQFGDRLPGHVLTSGRPADRREEKVYNEVIQALLDMGYNETSVRHALAFYGNQTNK